MTEKNRRENIREELDRGRTALEAAQVLHEHGFPNEAVSRLYYFLLYHIRALLLSEGLEPKSHEGALRLFSLHFVRHRRFPVGSAHVFSKLMKYREEADYNPSYTFTSEDFLRLQGEAQQLAADVTAWLAEHGPR